MRDLSVAIEQRTKAKIAAIDVAALVEESATQSANQSAIEQASDVAAGIVIKHRSSIRLEHERAQAIEALLDSCMARRYPPYPAYLHPEARRR